MQRISGSLDEGRITFGEPRGGPGAMAVDPVCGMQVERGRAAAVVAYHDRGYFFCSESCKAKFEADPEAYVKDEAEPEAER